MLKLEGARARDLAEADGSQALKLVREGGDQREVQRQREVLLSCGGPGLAGVGDEGIEQEAQGSSEVGEAGEGKDGPRRRRAGGPWRTP